MSQIILPDHPLFDLTLATPPPDWVVKQSVQSQPVSFVKDATTGIFRTASQKELEDYLWGGEYDEVMGDELEVIEGN